MARVRSALLHPAPGGCVEALERGVDLAAHGREAVGDLGRDGGFLLAPHERVGPQSSRRRCVSILGETPATRRWRAPKRSGPASHQRVDHVGLPLAPERAQQGAGGAGGGGRRGCLPFGNDFLSGSDLPTWRSSPRPPTWRSHHELEPPAPTRPWATAPPWTRWETLIVPRAVDLGEMEVRRALPSVKRQMVGPFIFFDQMGPAEFLTDQGIDVRPPPAHQPRHADLPLRGPDPAPGQPGHRPRHRARRGELRCARGAGSCTSERTSEERRRDGQRALRHPDLDGAARGRGGVGPPPSCTTARASCPWVEAGRSARPAHRGLRLRGDPRRSGALVGDALRRPGARAPGARCRSTAAYEERARSTRSRARSRWRATGSSRGQLLVPAPRRRDHRDGRAGRAGRGDRGALHALRRRADGGAALHLVELRLLAPRAHRAGEGGVGRAGPLRDRARATRPSSSPLPTRGDAPQRATGGVLYP